MRIDSLEARVPDLTGEQDPDYSGIFPDRVPEKGGESSGFPPGAHRSNQPIELPRVVMRGALAVALGGLLLSLLLGLWRAQDDMGDEIAGAMVLARTTALLSDAARHPRESLLASLQALQTEAGSRHLHLELRDSAGRDLLSVGEERAPHALLAALVWLNRLVFSPPPTQAAEWSLTRPDGEIWALRLVASPDSEQREALEQLLELVAVFALSIGLMLVAMNWNVRRSFRPLRSLLDAIGRVERQDLAPLRSLPPMPIRELEAIAGALRHLAGALEQAEEARRNLSRQVLTLQEDERGRIARELHDELGQHLTALRVDAAWVQRRLADAEPELSAVLAGMSEQVGRVQEDVRALLTRLRPPGHREALGDGEETVERLHALLGGLVQAWNQSPGRRTDYQLHFSSEGVTPDDELPRELVLTVYRISQEALTNVERHAEADHARLTVRVERHAGEGWLHWSVEDDGRGLDAAAWRRGNGLAGVKERIWAAGGDLEWSAALAGAEAPPGLRLQARLPYAVPVVGGHV